MWVYTQMNLDSKSGEGKNTLVAQISSDLFYTAAVTARNGDEFMKMKADRAVQPGHHIPRCKTCFGERSWEDVGVFETSRSCTPGAAGWDSSNLAVLTVNSQRGVVKVAYWRSLLLPLLELLGI